MLPTSMPKGSTAGRLFAEADARANEPFEKVPPLGGGVEHGMIRELWTYRELAYFLAWRDIKVRYKQTVLGVLWAEHAQHGLLVPHLDVAPSRPCWACSGPSFSPFLPWSSLCSCSVSWQKSRPTGFPDRYFTLAPWSKRAE